VYNKAVLSCSNEWCNNLDFDCRKWWTLCLLWHWMQNKLTLRFWALMCRCYAKWAYWKKLHVSVTFTGIIKIS
jgi:hypothetical protein